MEKLKLPVIADLFDIGERYTITKRIGKGVSAYVVKATDHQTGLNVAIKHIQEIWDSNAASKGVLREISILKSLNHPGVTQVVEIVANGTPEDFDEIFIVTNYVRYDLRKLLISSMYFEESHIKQIVYNLICAMQHIHSAGILHRDIKPANILIGDDCEVIVCDFGISRGIGSYQEEEKGGDRRPLSPHVVTRWYRAPELILGDKYYSQGVDTWSIGCVIAEIATMDAGNVPDYTERAPLFPGTSWYPMSPKPETKTRRAGYPSSKRDQLNMIFSTIGKPPNTDCVRKQWAKEYVLAFEDQQSTSIADLLPAIWPQLRQIMQDWLTFDPQQRPSFDNLLQNEIFDDIRLKENEKPATQKWNFVYEDEIIITQEDIRKNLIEYIDRFN